MSNIVRTGIIGLDSMLYGGMPEGTQVLLAGGPGSGKTLLAFEYLYRNAKEGNPGLFVAFDEEIKSIVSNAKSTFSEFGGEIDALVSNKMLNFQNFDPSKKEQKQTYEFAEVLDMVAEAINTTKATRVVIDSISILSIFSNDQIGYRKSMFSLASKLRELRVTSLVLIDITTSEKEKLEFTPEYFIFDGAICMYQEIDQDKRLLAMEVLKMRGSKHSFITTPYEITEGGFKVFAAEEGMVF